MIKPGYIRIGIDRKVYFEPDGLPEPKIGKWKDSLQEQKYWYKKHREYEASKQLIEVSNGKREIKSQKWLLVRKDSNIYRYYNWTKYKNNQPCKAEVTDNKATIVELN